MKNLLKSTIGIFIFSMMMLQLSAQCSYTGNTLSGGATFATGNKFGQVFQANGCNPGDIFSEITFQYTNINNPVVTLEIYDGQSDNVADLLYSQPNNSLPADNGDGTYTYALNGGTGSLSFTSGQTYTIIATMLSGTVIPRFSNSNPVSPGQMYVTNSFLLVNNDFYYNVGTTTSTPACDNSNETTTGTYTQIFSGDKVGQSITADASCYTGNAFSKFSFWSNTNSPTSWTVEIFNGETVSGSPIYSETDVAVVQSNLGGYSHVNLGTGQNITGSPVYVDGQVYTFLLTNTGGTVVAHHTGDTYAGGKAYDGSSFQAGEDLRFQIEANTMAPTIPTMGEWALIIFGLIVLSFGVVSVMRFQKMNSRQFA